MSAKITDNQTPLMKQYFGFKQKYPDTVLLFRVGDFYETFGTDAVVASKVLGIVLTKRGAGSSSETELAGFPHHSLDTYLPKLVKAGHKVAICDQLEDPKMAKGIVKRGVTELVTPGVVLNDKVLDAYKSNYLAAVYFGPSSTGLAFLDISTGEFLVAEGHSTYIEKLLSGFKPSELIVSKTQMETVQALGDDYFCSTLDEWVFQSDFAQERLNLHFATSTLKGFGIAHMPMAIIAAGSALYYLEHNQQSHIKHINAIQRIEEDQYVWFDPFTIRNLEVINPSHQGGTALIDVLDKTLTPMGSRLLKKWMVLPLKNRQDIQQRLDAVEALKQADSTLKDIQAHLQVCGDMERIISKVASLRANPREVLQLSRSLQCIHSIQAVLAAADSTWLRTYSNQFLALHDLVNTIDKHIQAEAPLLLNKGQVIQAGIDSELDELRDLQTNGKEQLLNIQKRESERTGIPSLKIAFNNVFGYYLEVTNTHKDKVPTEWIRKQTLTNAERYITEELKAYEEKILSAESKIAEIESRIYQALLQQISESVPSVQVNAQAISKLDVLCGFAQCAIDNHYVKPQLNDSNELHLKACRHPVIERQLPIGTAYIPNDITLDADQKIIILTGPNMSGKSAVLRQTALAVMMGQMGSFVAADFAEFGCFDRIYTRVGASDNLSAGESTFMVEMIETASILNNISNRSLILLDEIGRGTSTFDGVSLAWSIAEFLGHHPGQPKTIFATHYHELNELEKHVPGIVNFHISVKETTDKVIFLRHLVKGGSEHSFGIHVARMAGVPKTVLYRAEEILSELEKDRAQISGVQTLKQLKAPAQLNMFAVQDAQVEWIKQKLHTINVNELTPIEGLMVLQQLKDQLKD